MYNEIYNNQPKDGANTLAAIKLDAKDVESIMLFNNNEYKENLRCQRWTFFYQ